MPEDIIASLTRQVKEEVLENYIKERRLIEVQIEDLGDLAKEARGKAVKAGRRLNRLAFLLVRPERRPELKAFLKIPSASFWECCIEEPFSRNVPVIRVGALTAKGKFRKLFLEAYSRSSLWMERYRDAYEDLQVECRAVNRNISCFRKNFDLLTILAFLRGLDSETIERMNILGNNFTSHEVASLDRKLFIPDIVFDKFDLPPPVAMPETGKVEGTLARMAKEIYEAYAEEVRRLLR
jgi:hypothetical protein